MRYRLNIAANQLATTSLSIQEIATDIGYHNPLTFSKIFKQEFGVSPKHYREEKNGSHKKPAGSLPAQKKQELVLKDCLLSYRNIFYTSANTSLIWETSTSQSIP